MKQGISVFAAFTFCVVVFAVQARPYPDNFTPAGAGELPSFTAADRNRDGAVSKVEAIQARLLLRYDTFEELDRDHNGRLNRFEYDLASSHEPPGQRRGG